MAHPLFAARPLFDGLLIGEALTEQRQEMTVAIAALRPDVLETRGLDELAAEFGERFRIGPLVLTVEESGSTGGQSED